MDRGLDFSSHSGEISAAGFLCGMVVDESAESKSCVFAGDFGSTDRIWVMEKAGGLDGGNELVFTPLFSLLHLSRVIFRAWTRALVTGGEICAVGFFCSPNRGSETAFFAGDFGSTDMGDGKAGASWKLGMRWLL